MACDLIYSRFRMCFQMIKKKQTFCTHIQNAKVKYYSNAVNGHHGNVD